MKTIEMCPACNAEFIDEFEEKLEKKGYTLDTICTGQCGLTTPVALVDGEVVEADTIDELIEKID